jgi:hypothetical protein
MRSKGSVVSFIALVTLLTACGWGGIPADAKFGEPAPPTACDPHIGYWMVSANGAVTPFGVAPRYGGVNGLALTKPIVGMAGVFDALGYWLVAADGGVFTFGPGARFMGSAGGMRLNQPIVGMASPPNGQGYWLVASDGGVFSFGAARFFGSTGALRLAQPVVGMKATPSGNGYWLFARDGGVFAFGDAHFWGSTADNIALRQKISIAGMASTETVNGAGYWLVNRDGSVFTFGNGRFYGARSNPAAAAPIIGMQSLGDGYELAATNGAVYSFSAPFCGDLSHQTLASPIVGFATTFTVLPE